MRPSLTLGQRLVLLYREIREIIRLLRTPMPARQIVFYVAQAQYISYFEGIIGELLGRGTAVCYISSDFDDPIFNEDRRGLHSFYLNKLYPLVAPFLTAKVIVYTMPDLNLFHIRRSIFPAEHIFIFHSLCSSHMGLRLGALDHFDTIFCNGPYHKQEIKKMESLYGLEPKNLVEAGYYRLEKIYAQERQIRENGRSLSQDPPLILIAPSWQKNNIIEACGQALVAVLLQHNFRVVLRPHPMTIYKRPDLLRPFLGKFTSFNNFHLDTKTVSEKYLHEADMMICDWSGVAMEFALGVERPVLFIDLPPKVHNPDYLRLGLEPLEAAIRQRIGIIIAPDQIKQAGAIVEECLKDAEKYRERIVQARDESIYHFGDSPQIGANYILSRL